MRNAQNLASIARAASQAGVVLPATFEETVTLLTTNGVTGDSGRQFGVPNMQKEHVDAAIPYLSFKEGTLVYVRKEPDKKAIHKKAIHKKAINSPEPSSNWPNIAYGLSALILWALAIRWAQGSDGRARQRRADKKLRKTKPGPIHSS